jgi:hypothetical protein
LVTSPDDTHAPENTWDRETAWARLSTKQDIEPQTFVAGTSRILFGDPCDFRFRTYDRKVL